MGLEQYPKGGEYQVPGQELGRPKDAHIRLGELVDGRLAYVGDYARTVLTTLFRDEPVVPFNPESLEEASDVEFPSDMKQVRRGVLASLGYAPKGQEMFDATSMELLNVHFLPGAGTLAADLNYLPMVHRIQGVSQTDIRLSERFLSRYGHSQHIAFNVARTMTRLALQQPEEFIRMVRSDLEKYGRAEGTEFSLDISNKTREAIRSILAETGISLSEEQIEALELSLEYTKYTMTYAYLHDIKTPSWGDTFMHAPGVDYSEDQRLGEQIAHDIKDPASGLPQLISAHGLDPQLLEVIVRRAALEEGDGTLLTYLMKDKGRDDGDGFDHDQDSGTVANLAHLAVDLLPGGFKHKRSDDEDPVGSFTLRLKLLGLMLAGGITKEELTVWCNDNGINPDLLYLAEEEVSIGRHIALHEFDDGEIRTVMTSPTAMKRILLLSGLLEALHYKGGDRVVTERLIQSIIGNLEEDERELFLGRNDYHVRERLTERGPSILYILDNLQGELLSEEELRSRARESEDGELILDGYLVLPATQRQILKLREGTLVRNQEGEHLSTDQIFNGSRRDGGATLVDRFAALNTMAKNPGYYYIIALSQEDISGLVRELEKGSPAFREAVIAALEEWSDISNIEGINDLRLNFEL